MGCDTMMTEKTLGITMACVLLMSVLSSLAFAFEVEPIDMTLQDAQFTEFEHYDVLTAIFSLFNGGSQQAVLLGHNMLYLNDTTASYWEYTSYVDLAAFSSSDCPILIATIDPGTSKNVKLCFIIPKDNSTGYSLIVNNNRYLKNLSTNEFMLEYVPGWFKTTAGAWCDDITTDTEYVNAIEFQINAGTILLLATVSGPDTSQPIPTWIKDNACLWSDNLISDYEYLDGIYWLIENGIVQL